MNVAIFDCIARQRRLHRLLVLVYVHKEHVVNVALVFSIASSYSIHTCKTACQSTPMTRLQLTCRRNKRALRRT